MASSFNLDHRRDMLRQTIAALPATVGTLAVNFYKDRFRAGGYYDKAFVPWQKRSPKAKRNAGRALLVQSGRLRRSIRISKLGPDSVTIGTDVPYARIHNEGLHGTVNVKGHTRSRFSKKKVGTGQFNRSGSERMTTVQSITGSSQVKAHTRRANMPKRQFMGDSAYLRQIITRKIRTEILKSLKR